MLTNRHAYTRVHEDGAFGRQKAETELPMRYPTGQAEALVFNKYFDFDNQCSVHTSGQLLATAVIISRQSVASVSTETLVTRHQSRLITCDTQLAAPTIVFAAPAQSYSSVNKRYIGQYYQHS